MIKYLIGIDGKSNLNDIFKRVRDGVSLIRLVLMKNIPEPLTEQLRFLKETPFPYVKGVSSICQIKICNLT